MLYLFKQFPHTKKALEILVESYMFTEGLYCTKNKV